jgi:hypothetical protein
MDLFKPRTWTTSDIGLLKAGTALLGVAVGLSLPKHCRGYIPLLVGGAILLNAKPLVDYFKHANDPSLADQAPFVPEDEGRTPVGENL